MNHFRLIPDFVKTNILTNFHDNRTENVNSREYKSQKVSDGKNFEVGLLCSYVPSCDPRGGANIEPLGHHMNKLGRGPQGDATY